MIKAEWTNKDSLDLQPTCNQLATDLISRADAIAAMGEEPEIWADTDEEWAYHNAWVEHISALKALPSAEGGDAEMTVIPEGTGLMKPCPDNGADLIRRADAIRWVKTECNPYGKPTLDFESGKKVIEHLVQMPSAEAVQKWIPCSKGLPKAEYGESDCVLATCCWKSDTKQRWIEKLYFNGGNWCYPTGEYFTQKVLAWMQLPKPYREDGE